MVEALTLEKLQQQVQDRYDYDEERVVGIMLARYGLSITERIIEQSYQYWHINSSRYFDVFWAGYGAYLPRSDESSTKKILNYPGNDKRAYFDLEAFVEIKNQFKDRFNSPYHDKLQLILVNYREGKLHFDESIQINLEENLDPDHAKIREIMELITEECRSAHQVAPIAKKIKLGRLNDIIKGVTISDIINVAIGLAGSGRH